MGYAKSPKCPCGAEKQTAYHLFNECQMEPYKTIRKQYDTPLSNTNEDLISRGHQDCLKHKVTMTTTVMEETQEVIDAIPHYPGEVRQNKIRETEDNADIEWWEEGFRRMFSDAGCTHPDDPRRQQVVIANFYGKDHPYNETDKLVGKEQTPYRGELLGMLTGLEKADIPTWVTLDNESVVERAQKIIQGCYDIPKDITSPDLWQRVANIVSLRGNGYFRVTWIKGHLDDPENRAYMEACYY